MKKILLCVMLLVLTTSTNVYAFIYMFDLMGRIGAEVSVGVTAFGIGTGFLRGSDAKTMINGFERDLSSSISFAPAAQFDIMIEYIPGFAAIETGVGYSYSSLTYEKGEGQNKVKNRFTREEITVPIMFRGMLDNPFFIPYSAVGVKFGIPVGDSYLSSKTFENAEEIQSIDIDTSDFSLDVSFAIGFEYNIKSSYDKEIDIYDRATSHYIGLRLGYDLNVISPLQNSENVRGNDFFHDNLSVSFTYRYLINHRWH